MKKILILTAFVISCLSMSAAPVSRAKAEAKARQFMAEHGMAMAEMQPKMKAAGQTAEQELLYVFNAKDANGFVIISGDDCTEEVLGYCSNGSFDEEHVPSSMKGWLEGTRRQIAYAAEHGQKAAPAIDAAPAIEPLLTCQWGQDRPYNEYCPTYMGYKTPTGCLATAMAQIMYYHKWPQDSIQGMKGYKTPTARISMKALPATKFKWEDMKDTYGTKVGKDEGLAEAELMQYVGYSVNMDYYPGASGAQSEEVPYVYEELFGYAPTVHRYHRDSYPTIEIWDAIILNELQHNRPVLYCGYTPNWEGHAFVCDGYDGKGFYHINWGWDGYGDGYFRLTTLNPMNTTSSGSASTDDGFIWDQEIIVGIRPEGEDDVLKNGFMIDNLTEHNGTINAHYICYSQGNYSMALCEKLADGSLEPVTNEHHIQNVNGVASGSIRFRPNIQGEGLHVIYPAFHHLNEEDWQIMGNGSFYMEETIAEDGTTSIVMHPVVDLNVSDLSIKRVVNNYYGVSETIYKMDFNLTNNGDNFHGIFNVTINSDTDSYPGGAQYISIYAGDTDPETIDCYYLPTGKFTLSFTTDDGNVIYSKDFDDYVITLESYEVSYDPLLVKAVLRNESPVDYNGDIKYQMFKQSNDKKVSTKTQKNFFIPAHGSAELDFTTSFKISQNEKYYFTLSHLESELGTSFVVIPEVIEIDLGSVGIETVKTSDGAAPAYNISGTKAASTPTRRLVIVDGKAVVQ